MTFCLPPSGIYQPHVPVTHRDDEYHQTGLDTRRDIKEWQFWYEGSHRFLPKALYQSNPETDSLPRTIDLGKVAPIGVTYS